VIDHAFTFPFISHGLIWGAVGQSLNEIEGFTASGHMEMFHNCLCFLGCNRKWL